MRSPSLSPQHRRADAGHLIGPDGQPPRALRAAAGDPKRSPRSARTRSGSTWRGLALALLALLLAGLRTDAAASKDTPFLQDVAARFEAAPELKGAAFRQLAVNRDGIVYVLTDRGVARLFDRTLAPDRSFRPLAGQPPLAIALGAGELFYLYADKFLANGWAGRIQASLPAGKFQRLAVAENRAVLVSGPGACELFRDGARSSGELTGRPTDPGARPYAWRDEFFLLASNGVHRLRPGGWELFHREDEGTALAFDGDTMLVGTRHGFYGLHLKTGRKTFSSPSRLPVAEVTCLAPSPDGVWVGTSRGAYHWGAADGRIRYYASRRWLLDDAVVDLALDPDGHLLVLTQTGLNKIEFQRMTLAEKAAFYERKIRQRHIRYGFCSELKLRRPGDISSAEMIDTDNDGSWSAYYMASQALHFGAT